jgi:hypothetical protein
MDCFVALLLAMTKTENAGPHPESLTRNSANGIGLARELVMPGLVPGIHVLPSLKPKKDVDGRDKPGHDEPHTLASYPR